jgi:hypothetical protein
LTELKEAAAKKKRSALKNIIQKSGSVKNLLYLKSDDSVVQKYLGVQTKHKKKKGSSRGY